MSISKERREKLRAATQYPFNTILVQAPDPIDTVSIDFSELRALLDMADERDMFRALLEEAKGGFFGFGSELERAIASAPADGRKPVPGVVRDHFHAVRDCLIVQAREYEYGDKDNPNAIACRSAVDWLERAIASAPAVPGRYGEHANDVVADSNWSAGARFGWNCAIVGDKDRLERAIQSRVDERAAAAPQRGGE